MKSLFLRIFLSFWMAQALFVVLAILVTIAFRPKATTWESLRATTLNDSVNAYEEGGQPQLRQYLDNLETTQHVRAYLFDEHGIEVRLAGGSWQLWAGTVFLKDFGKKEQEAHSAMHLIRELHLNARGCLGAIRAALQDTANRPA